MAVSTYVVKRGDTLWDICVKYASSISGNTTNAKINTLVSINGIKNRNLIYVGQVLKFSGSGSSLTPASKENQPTITHFGLQSDDSSGRSVFANWSHSWEHTKNYKCQWLQYLNGKWVVGNEHETTSYEDVYCQSVWSADAKATKVRFKVLPISDTYETKVNNETVTKHYFTNAKWSEIKEYDFANNAPLAPSTPSVSITDQTLTASIDNIDADKLDAKYIKFNIVKDNSSSVHTSSKVAINTATNYVSYQYKVSYGSNYKVRCCSVSTHNKESGWSDFSSNVGTKPSTPSKITTYRRNKRSDGSISAYLEWTEVTNAEYYVIEYTTMKEDFDTVTGSVTKVQTEDTRTSMEITGIESGHDYFFRVRAGRYTEGESDPTNVVTIPIGEPPAAPTTWSSSNSAFVGETMELNWTHNSKDGSTQTYADLGLKINDNDWVTFKFTNSTNTTTGEQTDETEFTYGKAISYKGELHVELNTSHANLKNAKVLWKVRTAGVTDKFSDTDWSIDRTIHIYEKPDLALSVTSGLDGNSAVQTLTSLPFYIRATVELDSFEVQKPIGYHLRILANEFYKTVDDAGRTKTINPGDAVYSKYFDTAHALYVEMTASNIDLETGMSYTVRCSADMSTGLSIEQSYSFSVSWDAAEYSIDANIMVDDKLFTAVITPYAIQTNGGLADDVTLSIYRRNYDGTLTEIASDVPNNGTAITDPHPALDYARYRLVAKDKNTGAISFYDMPGHRLGCTSVVIQWDEEWSLFETKDEYSVEEPPRSGSILVLPYNVKVSDSRKRDVSRVAYAGREYPVSYHGTLVEEGSSWSTTIPKSDVETIYALRRLSLWAGPAYIREPSGMGFWANVTPSFNVNYDAVTIPVSLDVVRVEGGV